MVQSEGEWSGRRKLRLSPSLSGISLNCNTLVCDRSGTAKQLMMHSCTTYWLRGAAQFKVVSALMTCIAGCNEYTGWAQIVQLAAGNGNAATSSMKRPPISFPERQCRLAVYHFPELRLCASGTSTEEHNEQACSDVFILAVRATIRPTGC